MMRIYRQGDVLLREVQIPTGAQPITTDILVRGEATGHAHRVRGMQVLQHEQRMFVRGEGQLTHEEHDLVTVPKGDYEVLRQREYNPQQNRLVQD